MKTLRLSDDRIKYTWLACLTSDQKVAIVESEDTKHWINMFLGKMLKQRVLGTCEQCKKRKTIWGAFHVKYGCACRPLWFVRYIKSGIPTKPVIN